MTQEKPRTSFTWATIAAAAMSFASPAMAQEVTTCDWRASALNLVEPWEDYTQTFANGALRVALIDTIEPAAAAFHLMVIGPTVDEIGAPTCALVSHVDGLGFSGFEFTELVASYDPEFGLLLQAPVQTFVPDTGDFRANILDVLVHLGTGEIATHMEINLE